MTCLRCGEVSTAAWPALRDGAGAAIGVDDELTEAAMTRLADASSRGGAVLAGPSGACGLAGLMAVLQTDEARGALGLDRGTRALVVATEKR
jgi:threonine dehydratase